MSYKNSLAGLDLGGGKAVIIGDPHTDKTEALLRAYGRFVEALGGRYLTACDVGTYNADLDVVARETRFAHGRSEAYGGCGDSSVLTAYGVFLGMQAAAQHRWGARTLAGRTVAVAGAGKVGSHLIGHLVDDGADVLVTDVDPAAVERVQARHPQVKAVPDTATLIRTAHDVYSPNALGGALDARDRRRAARADRLRRRQQPARHARGRRAAARARHPLRPRLPGERRRGHPGRGRAARLLLRPRADQDRAASSTSRCGCSGPPTRRASPPPSPRTGWPRSGCGRSAGWRRSACRAERLGHPGGLVTSLRGRDVCPLPIRVVRLSETLSLSRGRHAGRPARGLDFRTP